MLEDRNTRDKGREGEEKIPTEPLALRHRWDLLQLWARCDTPDPILRRAHVDRTTPSHVGPGQDRPRLAPVKHCLLLLLLQVLPLLCEGGEGAEPGCLWPLWAPWCGRSTLAILADNVTSPRAVLEVYLTQSCLKLAGIVQKIPSPPRFAN